MCSASVKFLPCKNQRTLYAGMAELADALDSGSSGGNFVKVQVLLPAPKTKNRGFASVFVYNKVKGKRT